MLRLIASIGICMCSFLSLEGAINQKDTLDRFLEISAGYYNYASIDELHSPMLYAGGNLFPGFRIIKQNSEFQDRFTLRSTIINRPAQSFSPQMNGYNETNRLFRVQSFVLDANQEYLYKYERIRSEQFSLYFLIQWNTWINLVANQLFKPEFLVSSLSPGVYCTYRAGDHTIDLSVSSNLLAYTCRDNYSNAVVQDYEKLSNLAFIFQNSMIQSFLSFQTVNASIGYTFDLNKRIKVHAAYEFRYLANQKPRPLTAVSGVYSTGIVLKLGKNE